MPSGLVRWHQKLWQTCTWLSRPVGWVRTLDCHPIGRLTPSFVRQTRSINVWVAACGYTTCFPPFVTYAVLYVMDTVFITWRRTSPHFDRLPAPPWECANPQCNAKHYHWRTALRYWITYRQICLFLLWIKSFTYLLNVRHVSLLFLYFFTLGLITACIVYE